MKAPAMDTTSPASERCPLLVCHCLGVSEDQLREVLATCDIRTLHDIRRHTGAGDGCTACHRRLKDYLETQNYASSPSPSCSAR
jgi:bacterioferritin-associated ferredoxin